MFPFTKPERIRGSTKISRARYSQEDVARAMRLEYTISNMLSGCLYILEGRDSEVIKVAP